ncbi:hypothetical protein D3C73_1286470 [compost metagenome]
MLWQPGNHWGDRGKSCPLEAAFFGGLIGIELTNSQKDKHDKRRGIHGNDETSEGRRKNKSSDPVMCDSFADRRHYRLHRHVKNE